MAYPYRKGLYLVRQKSQVKGVDHYGILDIGNRLRLPNVGWWGDPAVVHQTTPQIRRDPFKGTGQWEVLGKISDEAAAMARLQHALKNPTYSLIDRNCEQFARFVATGVPASTQLQAAAFMLGLTALAFVVFRR
jgi:hypothetical protein